MTASPQSQSTTPVSGPTSSQGGRRGSHILSTLLFLAAIGFAGAAGYLYLQDRDEPKPQAQPTADPGQNNLGSIVKSLQDGGVSADYGRGTGKSNQLTQPGQMITIGNDTLLVFVYNGGNKDEAIKDREAEAAQIDTSTMTLTTPSGRDLIASKTLHVFQGSNVIAIFISDDDATATKVEAVIEALP